MKAMTIRKRIIDEIAKIPDEKISEVFDIIHYFRLGLGVKTTNPRKILKFAGSWKDLSEDEFNEFIEDIMHRRQNAFISRRRRETSVG
jgi:hypothetical protein